MTTPAETASRSLLESGAAALEIQLTERQIDQLLHYATLIVKWSKVYNLTAVRDLPRVMTHHILDSLALISPLQKYLAGNQVRLLDVGSGAGLPGIVIAICCPELGVSCVDAVAKKVAFVQQTRSALDLSNLQGLHARVESLEETYHVIVSRAFSTLADFVHLTRSALAPSGGIWIGMKGKYPGDELAALPTDIDVFHVEQLHVPSLDAERCLIWMRPHQDQRE